MIKVVLIDLGSRRSCTLSAALADAGYEVTRVTSADGEFQSQLNQLNPEAVLVAASSGTRDTLEQLAFLHADFPKPLFMILAQEDQKLQAAAHEAGLSVYVAEGISPALVRTLVEVSVQRYEREHRLKDALAQMEAQLQQRTVVDRARCLIMERHGLSEKQAYQELRSAAMQKGLKLPELARQIMIEAAQP